MEDPLYVRYNVCSYMCTMCVVSVVCIAMFCTVAPYQVLLRLQGCSVCSVSWFSRAGEEEEFFSHLEQVLLSARECTLLWLWNPTGSGTGWTRSPPRGSCPRGRHWTRHTVLQVSKSLKHLRSTLIVCKISTTLSSLCSVTIVHIGKSQGN